MNKIFMTLIAAFLTILGTTTFTHAVTIQYTASDLPDVDPNQDLWQYSYQVSDHNFSNGIGFNITFELGLYDSLSPVSAPGGWDVISWNPDPTIPDDGAYDAIAVTDNPPLDAPFVVQFVWLGSDPEPGSQPFALYDSNNNWQTIETGNTVPSPVPLPSPLLFFVPGAAGLLWAKTKAKKG